MKFYKLLLIDLKKFVAIILVLWVFLQVTEYASDPFAFCSQKQYKQVTPGGH